MKIEVRLLTELKHPAVNSRLHSDKQIKEFVRSIEKFGQIRPIVIDEKGEIIAGNGLYDALVSMGKESASVMVMDKLTEKDKKRLMLADNKIFSLGVDDMKAFDEILAELDGDFDIPGFDDDLLKTIVSDFDDADDMLEDYGLIEPERKEEIQKAAEKYAEDNERFEQNSTEHIPVSTGNAPTADTPPIEENRTLERRYVVCPHCGEKIWL